MIIPLWRKCAPVLITTILSALVASPSAGQDFQWARVDGSSSSGSPRPQRTFCQESDGSTYVTGVYVRSMAFAVGTPQATVLTTTAGDGASYLAKYDAQGGFVWAHNLIEGRGQRWDVLSIAAASDGSVFAFGTFGPPAFQPAELPILDRFGNETVIQRAAATRIGRSGFLVRFDPGGNLAWAHHFDTANGGLLDGAQGDEHIDDCAVLSDGSVVAATAFAGAVTIPGAATPLQPEFPTGAPNNVGFNGLLVRYAPDGTLSWVETARGDTVRFRQMGRAADDSVVISASYTWNRSNLQAGDGPVFNFGTATELTLDGVVVPSTSVTEAGFVVRYASDGTVQWATHVSDRPNFNSAVREGDFAVAPDGSATVAGWITNWPVRFGFGGASEVTIPASPTQYGFLNHVAGDGSWAWVRPMDSADRSLIDGVGAHGDGSVSVSVAHLGDITFSNPDDTVTVVPQVPGDFGRVIARYAADGTWQSLAPIRAELVGLEDACGLPDGSLSVAGFVLGSITFDTPGGPLTLSSHSGIRTPLLFRYAANLGPASVELTADADPISAFGGETTITATPRDQQGNVVGSGLAVALQTTAGDLIAGVLDLGDGSYSQTLRAVPGIASALVTATVDGVALPGSVAVGFVGVDAGGSTITSDPDTTALGGHAVVTVTPRDDQGAPVGAGRDVAIQTTLGTLVGPVVDQGDGTYTQAFDATAIGTAAITAIVDGLPLQASASIAVLDPAALGTVIGLQAGGTPFAYASIQAAVDAVDADLLQRILITPGDYAESVVVQDLAGLDIEGLSASGPVLVDSFRFSRTTDITLRHVAADGGGSSNPAIRLVGGGGHNERFVLRDCVAHDTNQAQHGVSVGKNNVDVTIERCLIANNGRNGILLDIAGGPYFVRDCTISGNGRNGVRVGKNVVATLIDNDIVDNGTNSGQTGGRYGILRIRKQNATPEDVTLIDNVLSGNRGAVVAGQSDEDLGNYDQMIDPTDVQPPY